MPQTATRDPREKTAAHPEEPSERYVYRLGYRTRVTRGAGGPERGAPAEGGQLHGVAENGRRALDRVGHPLTQDPGVPGPQTENESQVLGRRIQLVQLKPSSAEPATEFTRLVSG